MWPLLREERSLLLTNAKLKNLFQLTFQPWMKRACSWHLHQSHTKSSSGPGTKQSASLSNPSQELMETWVWPNAHSTTKTQALSWSLVTVSKNTTKFKTTNLWSQFTLRFWKRIPIFQTTTLAIHGYQMEDFSFVQTRERSCSSKEVENSRWVSMKHQEMISILSAL